MRLLFLSTIFPNELEPVKGVFNRNLVRSLAAMGHEVRVIAPIPWTVDRFVRSVARERREGGVTVYHPRYWYVPKILGSWSASFYRRSIHSTLGKCLDGFHPDAVVGYWAHPDGQIAVDLARNCRATSGVIIGGSDVLILTQNARRKQQVCEVLRSADSVLTVSESLRTRCRDLGTAESRVHVWRQGIDTGIFRPGDQAAARRNLKIPNDRPVVLWVGRMEPVKGLDVLVRAVKSLRDEQFPIRVYLVGGGKLRGTLEQQARELGVAAEFVFAGPTRPEELGDWYRAADLTVLPSRSEGLPNVLRESVASGTRFVASDVGGIAEIADDEWDRLVPPDNPRALADAIRETLTSPKPKSERQPVLSWTESAQQFLDVLMTSRQPQLV
jgi:teichuronic acid biosynthesis glycosyltransferase TuaC